MNQKNRFQSMSEKYGTEPTDTDKQVLKIRRHQTINHKLMAIFSLFVSVICFSAAIYQFIRHNNFFGFMFACLLGAIGVVGVEEFLRHFREQSNKQ